MSFLQIFTKMIKITNVARFFDFNFKYEREFYIRLKFKIFYKFKIYNLVIFKKEGMKKAHKLNS